MVSYDQAASQTGLWVFVGLIVAISFVGFYGYRLLHFLLASGGLVKAWRSERQRRRARRLTAQGIAFFNAGAMDRAERVLKNNADSADEPAVNYLYAARAADARGDIEERERYLRLAMDVDPVLAQCGAGRGCRDGS
ncbi:MAG: heme biosynthesis HemY N-terminal domain-containing protein [Gammaproteobacteria bacterium]|nr:heme biosynthesis HemY N-terminal domain-containing protein [Gammaproteobacteria bacterium]